MSRNKARQSEDKVKLSGKFNEVITLINELVKHLIIEKCKNQSIISKAKIMKLDFSHSLRFIRDNSKQIFGDHISLNDEKELEKIVNRCIQIRNKVSHQDLNTAQCKRDMEHLCRLAAVLGSDAETKVRNALNDGDLFKHSHAKWESLKDQGNSFVNEGRLTEAMLAYTEAIRINVKQPVLYANRAIVELRLGMYEEAREDAEDAMDLSTATPDIKHFRLLSEALEKLELFDEAAIVCQKGLELDSRDEVLKVRARDIESKKAKKIIDQTNPREDLKVSLSKLKNGDLTDYESFLRKFEQMNPKEDDIFEITNMTHFMKIMKISYRVGEAHHWFSGLNEKKVDREKAARIFEETANSGSAEGLYNLGLCYSRGYGVLIDYSKMNECFRKAAAQKPFHRFDGRIMPTIGVAEAENALGNSFRDGNGVDMDYERAFKHYLRGAQLGNAEAQNNLGNCLYKGQGVAQNYEFAREWYKRAAEQGIAEGQFNYAGIIEKGEGGPKDEAAALEYYRKAAEQGSPGALVYLERVSKSLGDKTSLEKFQTTFNKSKEKKDANALFLAGVQHVHGQSGVDEDPQKACEYLKQAADLGHLEAMLILSQLYIERLKKSEEGFNYCLKAADKGSIDAQIYLASLYAFGHGCQRDEQKARRLAKRVSKMTSKKDDLDIEELIKAGRDMCAFETNLDNNNLSLTDRMVRFTFNSVDNDDLKRSFLEFSQLSYQRHPINPKPKDLTAYLPQLYKRVAEGSITAKRMIDGIGFALEAVDAIDSGQYDLAMKLLRKSHKECDKMNYFSPEKIIFALEKCDLNNPDAVFVKGLFYGNDTLGASEYLKRWIPKHPKEADLYHLLACMNGFLNKDEESLKAIDKALELDSSNPRWFYTKATALRFLIKKKTGYRIDETVRWYLKYLDSNPNDDRKVPEAYFSLAFVYSMKDDMENVKFYWNKGIDSEKLRLPCFKPVGDDFSPKKGVELIISTIANKCGNCKKTSPKFKCVCQLEPYCDKDCQKAHWSIHKQVCKARTEKNPQV